MDCVHHTQEQIAMQENIDRLRYALSEALGDLGWRGTVDEWIAEVTDEEA